MQTHLDCRWVCTYMCMQKLFAGLGNFCGLKLHIKYNRSLLTGVLYCVELCGWYNRTCKKTRTTLSNFSSRKIRRLVLYFGYTSRKWLWMCFALNTYFKMFKYFSLSGSCLSLCHCSLMWMHPVNIFLMAECSLCNVCICFLENVMTLRHFQ